MINQKLRGFVGQTMGGRKKQSGALMEIIGFVEATSSTGTITAPRNCVALIYAFGGGGGGAFETDGASGSGAGALYKRLRMNAAQQISYSVGAGGAGGASSGVSGSNGSNTTVTLPSGKVITAFGGEGGLVGGAAPVTVGGRASGGDLNRTGGGGIGEVGSPATGDVGSGTSSEGGGGAGFSDHGLYLRGGNGGIGSGPVTPGSAPGGGGSRNTSGAGAAAGDGGAGKVVILLVKTV